MTRLFLRVLSARLATYVCTAAAVVTLGLIAAPAAGAAASVFGGGAPAATGAAKPAAGNEKAATGAAKAPAVKVKTAPEPKVKVAPAGGGAAGTEPAATTAAPEETGSGVNSSLVVSLVLAILLLGGIAYVIVRNARSVAPVVEAFVTGGSRNPEAKLRKRRAQAKAARQQRKRHRKR